MTSLRRSGFNRLTRGRPDQEAVRAMAIVWLDEQRKVWPDYVAKFQASMSNDETIDSMVATFMARFGQKDTTHLHPWLPKNLATTYLRYSCDNSNMRSLCQQLLNVLTKSNADGLFIPWTLVFADAEITGTIAARKGYQESKRVILEPGNHVRCLYVDDIGRASRDLVELLSLFRSVIHSGKRVVSVSDGFDTNDENARLLLTFKGMFVEQFIEQLRQKVSRGMKDGFRTGKTVTGEAFGYVLVDQYDSDGKVMKYGKDKTVRKMEKIPEQVKEVQDVFDKFVNKKWSAHAIANDLNERRVLHPRFWKACNINQMLTRHLYAGYEFWGKSTVKQNPETGKLTAINKPASEWQPRRERPELQIISEELFDQAQERLAFLKERFKERQKDNPKTSRTDLHPKLLIRPICHACRWPLGLVQSLRSGYGSLKCTKGFDKNTPCGRLGCKALNLINKCVLGVLKDEVFTPEFLNRLLAEANAHLQELAKLPKEDTKPMKQQIAEITQEEKRLAERLTGRSEEGIEILFDRLKDLAATRKRLTDKLHEMESCNNFVPQSMGPHDMVKLLQDLEALFQMEVGESATVLKRILGDVVAEPSDTKSKHGKAWMLRFTINGAALMAETNRFRDYPTKDTWEYLSDTGWIMPGIKETVVEVSEAYPEELKRVRARELRAQGLNFKQIAEAMKTTLLHVNKLMDPDPKRYKEQIKSLELRRILISYERLAIEGLRLRAKGLSIGEICGELKTRRDALLRAFDMAKDQGWDLMAGENAD